MALAQTANDILSWYAALEAKFVDIVGDYAGQELFLVEGDSFLLECFKDSALDFDAGIQILHAVYIVERFLQNLSKRGCRFDLVFFDTHSHACAPSDKLSSHKYLLARLLIINHLKADAQKLKLLQFESPKDLNFWAYVENAKVYFIACSDGAMYSWTSVKATKVGKQDTSREIPQAAGFRRAFLRQHILQYVTNGLDVALLNGMEFRDSKAFCFVIPGSKELSGSVNIPSLAPRDSGTADRRVSSDVNSSLHVEAEHHPLLAALGDVEKELGIKTQSWRLRVAVLTLRRMSLSVSEELFPKACLIHTVLLEVVPLSRRNYSLQRFEPTDEANFDASLYRFCQVSLEALNDQATAKFLEVGTSTLDYLDGRLLRHVWNTLRYGGDVGYPLVLKGAVDKLLPLISPMHAVSLGAASSSTKHLKQSLTEPAHAQAHMSSIEEPLLAFSHPAFDKHLSSIHVTVETRESDESLLEGRSFLELKHWHNSRKHLLPKKGHFDQQYRDPRAMKRHQRLLKDLQVYAASLTNASGKELQPEQIYVDASPAGTSGTDRDRRSMKQIGKGHPKPGSAAATKHAMSKKDAIKASQAQKRDKEEQIATLQAWKWKREDLDKILNPSDRFCATKAYEVDVEKRKKIGVIRIEMLLYRLAAILQIWKGQCQRSEKDQGYHLAAIALDLLDQLSATSDDVPKEGPRLLKDISQWLGLPVPGLNRIGDRSLLFPFFNSGGIDLGVEMDPIKFRLLHGGPFMDRSMGSQPDDRVPFQPDAWQKQVLDELDKHTSLLLVVPTGGGKTFISFYAMERILRANDDDVVVYVAPTKALVNQIAAEITARFAKRYNKPGRTLCGIHTRDFRLNNPTQCQVLVTVPHILQIMLLSPSNKEWVPRVKTIIFDEVHSISASDDGVVWEQLLMMAPCQILALSATVGNPEAFGSWLRSTQEAKDSRFGVIKHEHRFSDLRKYYFQPIDGDAFHGVTPGPALGPLGLESAKVFEFLHPISSLTSSARSIPTDLALESRDCYLLFDALKKCETKEFPLPNKLALVDHFASDAITKAEVISWAKEMKDVLAIWMGNPDSPFQQVVAELSKPNLDAVSDIPRSIHSAGSSLPTTNTADDVVEDALPLLRSLYAANALPAILFNFARGRCEEIMTAIFDRLVEAERSWKDSSRSWKNKLAAYKRWQENQEAAAKRADKMRKKAGKGDRSQHDDASGQLSKTERGREASESIDDSLRDFDPDAPLDSFSFANRKKADSTELSTIMKRLRFRGVNEILISAFQRGIAAHHAGLNKAYRQAVEIWFRRGYLTVVVATGTLALGINMPCKTVVFTEDSVFLNTLNYRQASGRAGRRGFDLLGNVVFHGISKEKARRLMSARIPALIGHFPVTTSLVLRLLILLHNTDNAEYALKMVDSLLSQPRLYLGGDSFRHQVLHHLRFSIEYLRRQGLVAGNGAPINFASSVAHLYYVEQSAFGFHALLRGEYFSDLAEGMYRNEEETLRTLMLVMAHLFFRNPMRQSEKESEKSERIRKSPSVVFLPPLPEAAVSVLRKHNEDTLKTYTTYVRTFVEQHCKDPDDTLPFTKVRINTQSNTKYTDEFAPFASNEPPVRLRSPFVALSGHTDSFPSISALCDTVRSGVFLEKAVVPYIEISDVSNPLNAAIYDFYRHGALNPLVEANKVRRGDVWFLLNDFSMVLATLVSSLEGFLASGGSNYDGDVYDDAGDDSTDEEDNEKESERDVSEKSSRTKKETKSRPPLAKAKNAEILENWDDADNEDDDDTNLPLPQDKASNRPWSGSANTTRTPSPTKSSNFSETASTSNTSEIDGDGSAAAKARETEKKLRGVLFMFQRLKAEFDGKFHKIWA